MLKSLLLALLWVASVVPADALDQDKTNPADLVQYIRDSRKAGLDDGQIQRNAIQAGWPAARVSEVIANLHSDAGQTNEPAKTHPTAPSAGWEVSAPLSPAAIARSPSDATPARSAQTADKDTAAKPPVTINRGVSDDYRIGEGDVLQINVFEEPAVSVNSVVVRPDGKISLPLIKEVSVVGLTPVELEKIVTAQLSRKIKAPDVAIVVVEINSKKVFVTGAVKEEGPIRLTSRITVMQAIVEAGGLTDYARRKKIYVLRYENGIQHKFPFDYDAVKKGEHVELDIPLQAGDTIVVP